MVFAALFCWAEARAAEPVIPLGLFRISEFSVSNSIWFIVGFVMFGPIIYISLYLQTVHAATPTSPGMQVLPLVCGMLVTFTISGRPVTRWGRYKIFPVVGTAAMPAGLFLFWLLTPSTPVVVSSVHMVVLGAGIGCVMQVLVVAVQNAVPQSRLGTATSTATFCRSICGAFGVAVFGRSSATASPPACRDTSRRPRCAPSTAATSPPARPSSTRSPAIHHGYVLAFSDSPHAVFLIGAPVALLAFALTWLLKDLPLRGHAYLAAGATRGGNPLTVPATPPRCNHGSYGSRTAAPRSSLVPGRPSCRCHHRGPGGAAATDGHPGGLRAPARSPGCHLGSGGG